MLEYELEGHVRVSRFQSFIPWQYVIAMHSQHDWPREENARVAMGFAAEIADSLDHSARTGKSKTDRA